MFANLNTPSIMQAKSGFTVFIICDLRGAQAFYTRVFGFHVVFDCGWYCHLANESGVQVGFLQPDLSAQPEAFRSRFSGGAIFSLEVEDAQAAMASVSAKGIPIVVALRDEPWGQRHFAVRDPNGIMIDVVQTIDATPEFQALYVQP